MCRIFLKCVFIAFSGEDETKNKLWRAPDEEDEEEKEKETQRRGETQEAQDAQQVVSDHLLGAGD